MVGEKTARIVRVTSGSLLLLVGLALLVLPGPGIFAICAGAALLERDLPVVRRLLDAARARFAQRQPETVCVPVRIDLPPSGV